MKHIIRLMNKKHKVIDAISIFICNFQLTIAVLILDLVR